MWSRHSEELNLHPERHSQKRDIFPEQRVVLDTRVGEACIITDLLLSAAVCANAFLTFQSWLLPPKVKPRLRLQCSE